jgi:hypothetical protein
MSCGGWNIYFFGYNFCIAKVQGANLFPFLAIFFSQKIKGLKKNYLRKNYNNENIFFHAFILSFDIGPLSTHHFKNSSKLRMKRANACPT